MLEYNRVFQFELAYISLTIGIRLRIVRFNRLKIKPIMLDNHWLRTSDKSIEYEKLVCNLLDMNVVRSHP